MTSLASIPITCSLRDPRLVDLAIRASIAAGGAPKVVEWQELADHLSRQHYSALIYDLAPYDARTEEIIRTMRDRRPWAPVALCVASSEQCLGMVPYLHGVARVHVLPDGYAPDGRRFEEAIRSLIGDLPLNRAPRLILEAMRTANPVLQSYLRSAVYQIESKGTARVASAARGLTVSLRTLQRSLREEDLPGPKELLDWTTFVYVSLLSEVTGMPLSKVGRHLGLDSHDLYRLRLRLPVVVPSRSRADPAAVLPSAMRALGARCNRSPTTNI